MNKLVLLTTLCLLSVKMNAQDINENLRKQHLSVRGAITTKDWSLRGPIKSLKECTFGYNGNGQQAATVYCCNSEYSTTGVLLKRGNYSNTEKSTEDSKYYYSNNRIDSITGIQKKIFFYDNKNRLQKINTYGTYGDSRLAVVMEDVFAYDKHGMITQNTTTSLPDRKVTQCSYSYNKAGELTEQQTVSEENDILYTSEPDVKGQLYKTKIIYKKTPGNNTFSTMELNKQGDISATTSTYQDKAVVRTFQYEYDAQGNWLKQTGAENGKVLFSISRSISYYTKDTGTVTITTAADMPQIKPPLMPAEVVDSFIGALHQQQYNQAYHYCTGGRWGTAAQFSSVNMYGGITAAKILTTQAAPLLFGQTAVTIEATVYVEDPANGSGTFVQQFQLEQKGNSWKIAGIKLISSTRPSDNWSLNLPPQADFTRAQALRLSKAVYDTVSLIPEVGSSEDRIVRKLDTLRFFKDDKTLYCLAVFSNRGPEFGASTGWCDILLFAKSGDKWQLQTFLLNAGGGGMYGYAGRFGKLLRMGDQHVAIVLEGGLTHMGDNVTWVNITAFHQGKLQPVTTITTDYEYDNGSGEKNNRCVEIKYRFEKNGNPVYDLLLERYRCNGSSVLLKKATVPYSNGYKLPDDFTDNP
jgi:hypothetical protein